MEPILEVKGLTKYFQTPRGELHAVEDVSFRIERGKTLGVVGESGCGKSTLGRVVLGLIEPTAGDVVFNGRSTVNVSKKEKLKLRTSMQMIFQDPYASLNPRMCVSEIIAEPLEIFKMYKDRDDLERRVDEIMETVGLAKRLKYSFPHELDGGRRQRIGIGRALILNPQFIVCDEPVSSLDVSIQAQILNLMMDLQEQKNLTYIFVTHNLLVVKHISDEILVMYLGCMMEKADAKTLFQRPMHPYTKGLLASIPIPDPDAHKEEIVMEGELASPINPGPGCRFASRCPYAKELCHTRTPEFTEVEPNHFVACHRSRELNSQRGNLK